MKTTVAAAQHTPTWSYDPDDKEIRSEEDGSVLFDIHNATITDAALAASAPKLAADNAALLAALERLVERCTSMASMLNSLDLPAYWHDALPHIETAYAAIEQAKAGA